MKILLQIPEGLKTKALETAAALEKEGNEVVISAEPCYGACDLKLDEAKRAGCEKIVHYGHTKFLETDFPVEYVEHRESVDIVPVLEKNHETVKGFKNLGLVSSLQFMDAIPQARSFLEKKGHAVFVGAAAAGEKKLYPGQILGCDISAARAVEDKVDAFLFLGCGEFHPLGLSLKEEKPVFGLDFEKGTIVKTDNELFKKQKYAAMALAKEAKSFGILVSTKPGQLNTGLAKRLKQRLEEIGKKAFVIALDEIKSEKLMGLEADCWINTACPRIAVENRGEFRGPVLNPDELEEAFP